MIKEKYIKYDFFLNNQSLVNDIFLVDELKYKLISISQLYDNNIEVSLVLIISY